MLYITKLEKCCDHLSTEITEVMQIMIIKNNWSMSCFQMQINSQSHYLCISKEQRG